METKKRCIFVLTKTNKIYINMKTQNTIAYTLTALTLLFILRASIQIFSNL